MIDIDELLIKMESVPKDGTLYLLEILPSDTGLFACNGNILYMVSNNEKSEPLGITTDFLHLETNVYVSAFNISVSTFENGYYNYVELKLSDINVMKDNIKTFVNLCLAHATYEGGMEFVQFFDSLVSLFQLPREQHYKNLIGLVGELLFIEYIYNEYGVDMSSYWHTEGTLSHIDFVSPFANFEVKTTTNDSFRFTIKHNQLFGVSDNTYLITIQLEDSNVGRSLNDIISSLQGKPNYCNSMQFSVNIEKEKRRVASSELQDKKFILKKVCAYHANTINPFAKIPDCVEDISYKLDLLQFSDIPLNNIIK